MQQTLVYPKLKEKRNIAQKEQKSQQK